MSLINFYRRKKSKDFSLGKGHGPYPLPSPLIFLCPWPFPAALTLRSLFAPRNTFRSS